MRHVQIRSSRGKRTTGVRDALASGGSGGAGPLRRPFSRRRCVATAQRRRRRSPTRAREWDIAQRLGLCRGSVRWLGQCCRLAAVARLIDSLAQESGWQRLPASRLNALPGRNRQSASALEADVNWQRVGQRLSWMVLGLLLWASLQATAAQCAGSSSNPNWSGGTDAC
jgi:hypothetical protein